MNCRYFACPACRVYVDAGYRWAYGLLEDSGLVTMNAPVDVELVAACTGYWNPPEGERSEWLVSRVLPAVRQFFDVHGAHRIIYTDFDQDPYLGLNWAEIVT